MIVALISTAMMIALVTTASAVVAVSSAASVEATNGTGQEEGEEGEEKWVEETMNGVADRNLGCPLSIVLIVTMTQT